MIRKDTHKYSEEQRKIAVDYYLNNGMSINKIVTALGYPGKTLLGELIDANVPAKKCDTVVNEAGMWQDIQKSKR